MIKFKPKLFSLLRTYSLKTFLSDLEAGFVVGIVALPIALAYAIASGVSPDAGLVTAIIAGLIVSALGGSRVQIAGPSGAFIVIVVSIIEQHGLEGLIISTFMAGIMLVIFGFLRLGTIIRYMPYPIVVGFTSAIAVIIFTTQLVPFFGLDVPVARTDFAGKWINFFRHLPQFNPYALALGLITIGVVIVWPKYVRKFPGSLAAIVITSLLVYFFDFPVETLGTRYGEIAATLPSLAFPAVTLETLRILMLPAFTIAMLCAIESLLSAMVADGYTGGQHRPNTELIAQGAANIVAPLFGGIPASGQLAKTMTNIKSGAKTPVSGIVHAILLILVFVFLNRFAGFIPMASMAGLLIGVAYKMSEWHTFAGFLRYPKSDGLVLLATFMLTLIFDLSVAIQAGLLLAVAIFIKRVNETSNIEVFRSEDTEELELTGETEQEKLFEQHFRSIEIPEGIEIYEIKGPFFFGVANKFDETMRENRYKTHVRILRMKRVPFIDSTGLHGLENLYRKCRGEKIHLIFSEVDPNALKALEQSGLLEQVGRENIFDDIVPALKKADDLVNALN